MVKPTKKLVPRDDRVTINHEFTSVEEFIAEYVTNISRSGVFIRTKAPLEAGTKVNLKFTVIMDELETIEGVGEVVRTQEEPTPGMGVVFVTLTSHSQNLITKLITRRRPGTASGVGGRVRTRTQPGVPPPPPTEEAARRRQPPPPPAKKK